jgi:hypothetical protein
VLGTIQAVVLAAAALPPVVEAPGVRIEVEVDNQIYTWTVTALGDEPISAFEVGVAATYIYTAPDGWETAEIEEGTRFRAWTNDPYYAIRRGMSREFTARVSTGGAPLGTVTASVETGFGAAAKPLEIPAVWGPVPKRRSMIALVAVTLSAIAALHALLLERRQRSTSPRPGK